MSKDFLESLYESQEVLAWLNRSNKKNEVILEVELSLYCRSFAFWGGIELMSRSFRNCDDLLRCYLQTIAQIALRAFCRRDDHGRSTHHEGESPSRSRNQMHFVSLWIHEQ